MFFSWVDVASSLIGNPLKLLANCLSRKLLAQYLFFAGMMYPTGGDHCRYGAGCKTLRVVGRDFHASAQLGASGVFRGHEARTPPFRRSPRHEYEIGVGARLDYREKREKSGGR